MAPKSKSATSSPKRQKVHYEFGGPFGAAAIVFGLPVLLYVMNFVCNDVTGCPAPSLLHPKSLDIETLKQEVGWPENGIYEFFSWDAMGWVLGYFLFSAILHRLLPGTEREGVVMRNGLRHKYKLNSFSSAMFTLAILAAGTFSQGAEFPVWTFISDNYLQLLTATMIFASSLAIFVYVRSFQVKPTGSGLRLLAEGGCTGNMMYDFYIGRELNPRVTLPLLGEIDIKEFMEVRPGLLGWIIMNCAFVAKQYRLYGYVSDSIVFITLVQTLYVLDCLVLEPAVLTTMDITRDGFGYMLSFGDLVWVPFLYSQQTRYLATHPQQLGPLGLAIVGSVLLTGFAIFRLSNLQKNTFRTNPDDPRNSNVKFIPTKTGSKLMISGWWGVSRHINYFGDWLQSFGYSVPTLLAGYTILTAGTGAEGAYKMLDGREVVAGEAKGWGMLFTYFYVIYFAVLLVHRAGRDDDMCAKKYGEDWEKYKKIVKWRIIPYVY